MAIVKCAFGHYYDDDRFKVCPMCEQSNNNREHEFGIQSQVTVSGYKLGKTSEGLTELLDYDVDNAIDKVDTVDSEYDALTDENHTIGFFVTEGVSEYTAGWIVEIEGPGKGISHVIHIGRNRCGHNSSNDICFVDSDVIPELHCSIVYESKQNAFFLVPENGLVFYNGSYIEKPVVLVAGDHIYIGKTELVFVPFCTKDRSW